MSTYIPEHIVIQHILPFADLPIDTRLHFGIIPKKLKINPIARQLLSDCIMERTRWLSEDPELASDIIVYVDKPSTCPVDINIKIQIRIMWNQENSTMTTMFSKSYGNNRHQVTGYDIWCNSHTGKVTFREISQWKYIHKYLSHMAPIFSAFNV